MFNGGACSWQLGAWFWLALGSDLHGSWQLMAAASVSMGRGVRRCQFECNAGNLFLVDKNPEAHHFGSEQYLRVLHFN